MERKTLFGVIFAVSLVVVIAIIALAGNKTATADFSAIGESGEDITVYKGASCGCCSGYIQYLQGRGDLEVETVEAPDITQVKDDRDIPANLRSCHTMIIGDYFVEGHVPLEAVNKLMEERPSIAGIAMAGMPSGSPGMPGGKSEPFVIYAVNRDGSSSEFMRI